jgi:hypothetical protein
MPEVLTEIDAFVAIPMPDYEIFLEEGDTSIRERLYSALDELTVASQTIPFTWGRSTYYPSFTIERSKIKKEKASVSRMFSTKELRAHEILTINAKIPYDLREELSFGEYSRISALLCVSRTEFVKQLTDLLVLLNLTSLGSVGVTRGMIRQDRRVEKYSGVSPMAPFAIQSAVHRAGTTEWPIFAPITIGDAWKWAKIDGDMLEGWSNSALARALSAFSRVLERRTEDEPMQLLWALIGLEAVFVTGKTELLQQVREKSQTLLGPQVSFKKQICRMYDFRSRFVHGDLDFPSLSNIDDASAEKFDCGLREATDVAIAILVATLLEAIRRNCRGFAFRYDVVETQHTNNV